MPIVTPAYVFVAVPKAGSSAVRAWLRETFDPKRGAACRSVGHGHGALRDVPPELREGRTSFAVRRDPLSWYASWYSHAAGSTSPQMIAWLRQYGETFREVLFAVTHPTEGRVPFRPGLYYDVPHRGLRRSFLDSGTDLYTWTMARLLAGVDVVIEYSGMEAGLSRLFGRPVCLPVRNTRYDRNPAAPADYEALYDAEMRGWLP